MELRGGGRANKPQRGLFSRHYCEGPRFHLWMKSAKWGPREAAKRLSGERTAAIPGPPAKPSEAVSLGKGRAVERASFRLQAEAKDMKSAPTCLPDVYQKIAANPWGARDWDIPAFPSLPRVYQSNFLKQNRTDFSQISPVF